MNSIELPVLALILSVVAAGCASSFQIPEGARPVSDLPANANGAAHLGPGDALDVVYFGREELSGQFPIDQDGTIHYPLAGRVEVGGMSGEEAADTLRERMRVFFNDPELSATPLLRVNVLGAVVRPGLYPMNPTLNIFDAIGTAGGPTREADFERILLVRGGDYYVVDTRRTLQLGRSLSQIGIQSGDVIVVPDRPRTLENLARVSAVGSVLVAVLNTVLILSTN